MKVTAHEESRQHLRATVRDILNAHRAGTSTTDESEQAIMDAVQRWVVTGYETGARPAVRCSKSGGTVSRWWSPDPMGVGDTNPVDPGPYRDGETIECPGCGASVAVTHRITNERETGTQYVGDLAEH